MHRLSYQKKVRTSYSTDTETQTALDRMTRDIARYGTTLGRHVLHVCTVHAVSSKLFTQLFELVCQLIAVRQKRWAGPGLRGTSLQRAGPFGPKTERSGTTQPAAMWDIAPMQGWDGPVKFGTSCPKVG